MAIATVLAPGAKCVSRVDAVNEGVSNKNAAQQNAAWR
jgi:hypothetical protein